MPNRWKNRRRKYKCKRLQSSNVNRGTVSANSSMEFSTSTITIQTTKSEHDDLDITPKATKRSFNKSRDVGLIATNLSVLFQKASPETVSENKTLIPHHNKDVDSITDTPKHRKIPDRRDSSRADTQNNLYPPKLEQLQVNCNPYLKEKPFERTTEIVRFESEQSVDEYSFCTSEFFNNKINSTPIQSDLKNSDNVVRDHESTPTLPITSPRVSFNTPLLTDMESTVFIKRRSLNRSRTSAIFNGSFSCSRLSSPVSSRIGLDHSFDVQTPMISIGMYARLIRKIKRCSKVSIKWTRRILDSCVQLGIQIRRCLLSIKNLVQPKTTTPLQSSTCKCDQFKEQIDELNEKVSQLTSQLNQLKEMPMEKGTDQLWNEFQQIKNELSSYSDMKNELASLKEQIKCIEVPTTINSLPPPPPPPPPPPMPLNKPAPRLTLGTKSKSTLGIGTRETGNRPQITLDEIMKVKLKKPSERTPSSRPPPSMPLVRETVVRPVKGFIRRAASFNTPTTSAVVPPSSPLSSLKQILENQPPSWRLKRLRKTGPFNSDSIYSQKQFSPNKRDRNNI